MSGSAAYPGRLYPGAICLTYDEGGSDCSFTSYAECLEAESGIGAVCFDNIAISLTTAKGLEFKAIINMNREPNAT
jgi:pyruvate-formate lyase